MNDRDGSFARAILDAMPLMIFVVDDDVRVHDLNEAAAATFGPDRESILKRRGGEVLHCLHALDVPAGCGRGPLCKTCVIRNSVASCLEGQAAARRRTKVSFVEDGKPTDHELLITASPIPGRDPPLALLIIEDISEVSRLRDIIPICAKCKKVRDDRQYWQSVETYFASTIGVEFSHGLCPACVEALYPERVRGKQEKPQ
jgi:PAS domain-containing protein